MIVWKNEYSSFSLMTMAEKEETKQNKLEDKQERNAEEQSLGKNLTPCEYASKNLHR